MILTYHSIDGSGSVLSTAPALFRDQVDCIVRSRRPVVPLAELQKSEGSIALTFDDGFVNFREHALPSLIEHRLPATVFVVTGYCGKRNDWNHRTSAAIPSLELMSWSQLEEVARAGIELGAHTVNHLDLASLPAGRAREELTVSKRELEDRTGRPVRSLAYPFGSSNREVRRIARKHFSLACGTELRVVRPEDDSHDLPRLDIYYLRSLSRFQSAVAGSASGYITIRGLLRKVRQIL